MDYFLRQIPTRTRCDAGYTTNILRFFMPTDRLPFCRVLLPVYRLLRFVKYSTSDAIFFSVELGTMDSAKQQVGIRNELRLYSVGHTK